MVRFLLLLGFLVLLPLGPFNMMLHAVTGAEVNLPAETDLGLLLQPGKHRMTLRVDDHDRIFIFVTPSGFKPGQPLPLVFFFHGAGGSAHQASHTYGWTQKAETANFFLVFPEGLPARPAEEAHLLVNPRIWRDGRPRMPTRQIDDVHFFEVLLDTLKARLPVDPRRVYVAGFSNGAAMTFTLGGRYSDRIAAIAPVSSQSFSPATSLARPLPVYYLTGTADPLIPYNGGTVTLPWGNTYTTPSVQETVHAWAQLDGCSPSPQVVSDENGVRVLRYGHGQGGGEILFTTVEGNGHHWPDTVEPLPQVISGPSLNPFNATDRIWDFFQTHPMR